MCRHNNNGTCWRIALNYIKEIDSLFSFNHYRQFALLIDIDYAKPRSTKCFRCIIGTGVPAWH